MIKRVICVLSVFCIMFGFAGCTDKEEEKGLGTFYSLQEVYDNGLLTKDNLKSIAYYHHNGKKLSGSFESGWEFVSTEYVPSPKKPAFLSTATESRIIREYEAFINCPEDEQNESASVSYYGTYNGYVVCMVNGVIDYVQEEYYEEIESVIFYYASSQRIVAWKI